MHSEKTHIEEQHDTANTTPIYLLQAFATYEVEEKKKSVLSEHQQTAILHDREKYHILHLLPDKILRRYMSQSQLNETQLYCINEALAALLDPIQTILVSPRPYSSLTITQQSIWLRHLFSTIFKDQLNIEQIKRRLNKIINAEDPEKCIRKTLFNLYQLLHQTDRTIRQNILNRLGHYDDSIDTFARALIQAIVHTQIQKLASLYSKKERLTIIELRGALEESRVDNSHAEDDNIYSSFINAVNDILNRLFQACVTPISQLRHGIRQQLTQLDTFTNYFIDHIEVVRRESIEKTQNLHLKQWINTIFDIYRNKEMLACITMRRLLSMETDVAIIRATNQQIAYVHDLITGDMNLLTDCHPAIIPYALAQLNAKNDNEVRAILETLSLNDYALHPDEITRLLEIRNAYKQNLRKLLDQYHNIAPQISHRELTGHAYLRSLYVYYSGFYRDAMNRLLQDQQQESPLSNLLSGNLFGDSLSMVAQRIFDPTSRKTSYYKLIGFLSVIEEQLHSQIYYMPHRQSYSYPWHNMDIPSQCIFNQETLQADIFTLEEQRILQQHAAHLSAEIVFKKIQLKLSLNQEYQAINRRVNAGEDQNFVGVTGNVISLLQQMERDGEITSSESHLYLVAAVKKTSYLFFNSVPTDEEVEAMMPMIMHILPIIGTQRGYTRS